MFSSVESLQTAAQCFASHICKKAKWKHSHMANGRPGLPALSGTKGDSTTKRQKIMPQGG